MKQEQAFGLLGRKLSHSFSQSYFTQKFERENIANAHYTNFELKSIQELLTIIQDNPNLKGLNVTIPYKEEVIRFLNSLDPAAKAIGAVNTVAIQDSKLTGHNTDWIGFRDSLCEFLKSDTAHPDMRALVLGTGGAAKAVWYALDSMSIPYSKVSRVTHTDLTVLRYEELTAETMFQHRLIINTTPLGMYPDTEAKPPIPYSAITEDHYAFDLIYNPEHTEFLLSSALYGAKIQNGKDMLIRQAEASWAIWNKNI